MRNCAAVVINLPHRVDRRAEMEAQLKQVNWTAEFFPAIQPKEQGEFPSIGARGCFQSHLEVLKLARNRGLDRLILIEDDLNFVSDFADKWRSFEADLDPVRWSIAYPGHYVDDLPEGLNLISPELAVKCTHFMVINGQCLPTLIDGLEAIMSRNAGHKLGGPMHVDGAYSTIRSQNPNLNTYCLSPILGYQRPSRTDIGHVKWFDRLTFIQPLIGKLRSYKIKSRFSER